MTIGTRAIWGAKLSRSPLYDISVSWSNFKIPAALIVTLRTDYQPQFLSAERVTASLTRVRLRMQLPPPVMGMVLPYFKHNKLLL
ncbi:conserved hypothetical protein [Klebsiella variicola]|nr:conserved hypothetical protein [Klebsiella variicola]